MYILPLSPIIIADFKNPIIFHMLIAQDWSQPEISSSSPNSKGTNWSHQVVILPVAMVLVANRSAPEENTEGFRQDF